MNKNTIILTVASIVILFGLIAYGSMQMKKPVVVEDNTPGQMDRDFDKGALDHDKDDWGRDMNQNPEPRPQQPSPDVSVDGKGGFTACTMEAKQCPDGKTYVGRQGPNCEFALCPGN
ncbi:MAG: hypothetical protein ACOYMZ_01865 [Minisyncoccia bacterium]